MPFGSYEPMPAKQFVDRQTAIHRRAKPLTTEGSLGEIDQLHTNLPLVGKIEGGSSAKGSIYLILSEIQVSTTREREPSGFPIRRGIHLGIVVFTLNYIIAGVVMVFKNSIS